MFLHQNRLFHKELFYTKTVLYTNTMFYTKNHVLAGPVQGLFVACRIATIHGGRLRAGRIIIHASSSAAVEILWARSHHGDIVAHASPRADLDSIHRRSTERKDKRTTEMNDGSEQTQCLFGIYIYICLYPEDPKYGLFACIWVCTLSERPTMLFAV